MERASDAITDIVVMLGDVLSDTVTSGMMAYSDEAIKKYIEMYNKMNER